MLIYTNTIIIGVCTDRQTNNRRGRHPALFGDTSPRTNYPDKPCYSQYLSAEEIPSLITIFKYPLQIITIRYHCYIYIYIYDLQSTQSIKTLYFISTTYYYISSYLIIVNI